MQSLSDLIDKRDSFIEDLKKYKEDDDKYSELEKKIKMLNRSIDKMKNLKNECMIISIDNYKKYLSILENTYKNI